MDQKDEVKSKVDIVDVISAYVPLKKSGRNFSGLCPFHSEKTPSFMVSSERQVFKCFGCGESGDVFTFLERIEGWDFREALEELAKRAGVKLKTFAPSAQSREKEKIISINELAGKFYSHILANHKLGEPARQYLMERGLKKEIWEKYGLGFAPGGWQTTFDFFKKRGFSGSDIAASGLVIARQGYVGRQGENAFYDRFRNRLVFPLRDSKGTICGFSARIINETSSDRKEPKYINSPETPIFNKGSMLFGLDVAKEAVRSLSEAVLVEGEFDVLSSFQSGIKNVVATKGTALTEKQVALLARICENVSLCFDTDMAGDAASRRGIELLDLAGVNVKVVRMGHYKDPDEYCKKDPEGFKRAIKEAENVYDFFIESAANRYDVATAVGKKKIGQEVLPMFSKISDDMVRAHYIEKLSRLLDLDVNLVAEAVSKKQKVIEPASFSFDAAKDKTQEGLSLEKYFLTLLVVRDEVEREAIALLEVEDFAEADSREFFAWLHDIIDLSSKGTKTDSKGPKKITQLLAKLPEKLNGFADELYLVNVSPGLQERQLWMSEVLKVSGRVRQASLKRRLRELAREIKIAQMKANLKQVDALTRKFNGLSKNLKEVK